MSRCEINLLQIQLKLNTPAQNYKTLTMSCTILSVILTHLINFQVVGSVTPLPKHASNQTNYNTDTMKEV